VFFWGNKIGDVGSPTPTHFTTTTVGDASAILAGGLGPAGGISNVRDIDRDDAITVGDRAAAVANMGAIVRLNIGAGGPFAPDDVDDDVGIASAWACATSATPVEQPPPPSTRAALTRIEAANPIVAACFEHWAESTATPSPLEVDEPADELEQLLDALASGVVGR
jgi:hypothetical protein